MIIITAFNEAFRPCGELCLASLISHHQRYPGDTYAHEVIHDDFDRPASWWKIGMIRRFLEEHDRVMWVDADTIVRGNCDLGSVMGSADLNVSVDDNGINCGVMAWKKSPHVMRFLEEIDADESHYLHHWWEQAAISARIKEISVNFQSKDRFNAYHGDCVDESWILHWPGFQMEERIPMMQKALKEAYP